MTSRGKKTRDLPNLTECHCCHRRVDLAKSKNSMLHLLYSEWRIVLLCTKCLSRVESTELCSYCFHDSSSGDDCFSCRQCRRRVHRDCDSEYRGSAVWSGSSSSPEEVSVCGDCWVSESLARWRRSRNSGGGRKSHRSDLGSRVCDDQRKRDLNSSHAVCDSSTEEATRCSRRLEVVEEDQDQENVDDVDDDVALKEGQGSCSNGVDLESPPCSKVEHCNCIIRPRGENRSAKFDPYYFKYRRRRISSDHCILTYKRRSIGIVECCKSLSNVDCALLTYKRSGSVNARFMFTYKRRRNFEQCVLTYKRRRPGILYASSKAQLEGPALDPDCSEARVRYYSYLLHFGS
ncbi:uncharacterized protein LOC126798444 isoform X2 [Argentina anserina]|uniref:uncharacterized protein LOC126798444 isoform X2 n=1 Tax=Argentina anserina TaxID=57926 RepID=UPI0021762D8B|nr:uncharacterized protein LOC126798444 isoform X2 [Potentilla anserina]